MHLILYSKPGCHLCEGLEEKLAQIEDTNLELEIRDITTNEAWFAAYQYEIPVLTYLVAEQEYAIPRIPPRTPVARLQTLLKKYVQVE